MSMSTQTSTATFDPDHNPDHTIRAMTADDIEWYKKLQIKEHGDVFHSKPGSYVSGDSFVNSVETEAETLKSLLTGQQDTRAYVATVEQRPIGAAVFHFSEAESTLQELHLDGGCKISGVGIKLLLHGLEEAKGRGVQNISADCYSVDGAKKTSLRGAGFSLSPAVSSVRVHGKAMCVQHWQKTLDGTAL